MHRGLTYREEDVMNISRLDLMRSTAHAALGAALTSQVGRIAQAQSSAFWTRPSSSPS